MQKKQSEKRPDDSPAVKAKGKKKVGARFNGKSIGRVKTELRTVEQIRKARHTAERKKSKNARPSKKGRR